MAGAVEGGERHDEDIGRDLRRLGHGLADAPLPARKLVAESVGAHDQRLAAPVNRRQRQLRAGLGQLAQQRQRIDLALQRHKAGDDHGGRYLKRVPARGNRFGGSRTQFRWHGVAFRQGFGAEGSFRRLHFGDVGHW